MQQIGALGRAGGIKFSQVAYSSGHSRSLHSHANIVTHRTLFRITADRAIISRLFLRCQMVCYWLYVPYLILYTLHLYIEEEVLTQDSMSSRIQI